MRAEAQSQAEPQLATRLGLNSAQHRGSAEQSRLGAPATLAYVDSNRLALDHRLFADRAYVIGRFF